MTSLYQKKDIYYLSVSLDGKRKVQSLQTKSYPVAKKLKQHVEFELLTLKFNTYKSTGSYLPFNFSTSNSAFFFLAAAATSFFTIVFPIGESEMAPNFRC